MKPLPGLQRHPSVRATMEDLRALLGREEEIARGVRQFQAAPVGRHVDGRWRFVTFEWLLESMVRGTGRLRIQRVLAAQDPLTLDRNEELPALRRYYRFPEMIHGLRVMTTRQLARRERESVLKQACVRVGKRDGTVKLRRRGDSWILEVLVVDWEGGTLVE